MADINLIITIVIVTMIDMAITNLIIFIIIIRSVRQLS